MSTASANIDDVHIDHLAPALPPEVFYSYVLPDVLSEHLHRYLLFSESPKWNPFYTLPLVSRHFHTSCRTLCVNIFGLVQDEGGSVIKNILDFTKTLWEQANLPPRSARPMVQYTYQQLMSSESLIQVYMCAAIAKCYLNLDVLWNIDLEQRWNAGELSDLDEEDMIVHDNVLGFNTTGYTTRRFRMRDDKMHRVYLPLTCALRLCDRIRPERVAYVMAEYLADIVPHFATVPMMLKCAQDLEMTIARNHFLDLEIGVRWTCLTLDHIQTMPDLLNRVFKTGKLVKSFQCSSDVPWEVINDTNIIDVLDAVITKNREADNEDILNDAIMARAQLLEPYNWNA